jgi:hypothetical protein
MARRPSNYSVSMTRKLPKKQISLQNWPAKIVMWSFLRRLPSKRNLLAERQKWRLTQRLLIPIQCERLYGGNHCVWTTTHEKYMLKIFCSKSACSPLHRPLGQRYKSIPQSGTYSFVFSKQAMMATVVRTWRVA